MLHAVIQFYLTVGFTLTTLIFAMAAFVPVDVMYLASSPDAVDDVREAFDGFKRNPLQLLLFIPLLIILGPLLFVVRTDPRRDTLAILVVFSLSALAFYASR
ncbi:hypothetical protein [Methylosinus sp. PW1]|uniref:hypothetical protein n=1 Tax=Methylosinus sp. PW1 TaxID=107636 RepID=UPI0005642053|nr:hypothetical protein [Methylosinus sp. PW1]